MEILVSIIIVNYNTAELLGDCITSVCQKTEGIGYEIIVVDNDSKESIHHLVEKYPTVHFIFSDENLGFGRANNLGATNAKGKYLLFLNPDTLLINNAVGVLFDFMEQYSQVGICGGNLYKQGLQSAVSYHTISFYKRERRILLNKTWEVGFNKEDKTKEVRVIMGADLFIRKDLFDKIGGFDPHFFMYFEEVLLCDRARQLGYKIVSVPQARIVHFEGAAAENKSEELNKWSYKEHWYSKFIYFYKTEGNFKTELLYQANLLKLRAATIAFTLKKDEQKIDYWKKKSSVLRQTYNRFRGYKKSQL